MGGGTNKVLQALPHRADQDPRTDHPLRRHPKRNQFCGCRLPTGLTTRPHTKAENQCEQSRSTSAPPVQALRAVLSLHPRKPARHRSATRAKTLSKFLKNEIFKQHEYESVEGGVPLTSLPWRASVSPAHAPGITHDAAMTLHTRSEMNAFISRVPSQFSSKNPALEKSRRHCSQSETRFLKSDFQTPLSPPTACTRIHGQQSTHAFQGEE